MAEWNAQANALFLEALDRPAGPVRTDYLNHVCDDDGDLKAQVVALLEANERAGEFLSSPVQELRQTAVDAARGERPGSIIGPYKLLQEIGEGGMGVVYMAEQSQPVRRTVALKIIKPGMDSRQVVARFEAERQALALMDHQNIAKVFDAGTTDAGRPFFAMELVKGIPITQYCDEHQLAPRQRMELFLPVCKAIQHAHQKGVIHRDLKPSNVMVASYDGQPVPKVIDFGVAKATGPKLTELTLFTEFGAVLGTLEYMSPEQAELNQLDVDTRSDIYSLGVLLYELLTGTTPLGRERKKDTSIMELLRLIREDEPARPSTRLSTAEELPSIAARRGVEPKTLTGLIRGDLDSIVMKAIEKDRNRRYETANSLANDIVRYLSSEAVEACPPSTIYRLQKVWRRNRLALSAAAAVAAALLIGIAGSSWQAVRAIRAQRDTETARSDEAAQRMTAQAAQRTAESERRRAEQNSDELIRNLYVADIKVAHQALQEENLALAKQLVDKYLPAIGVPISAGPSRDSRDQPSGSLKTGSTTRDLLGWEWHYLWQLCQGDELFTLDAPGHEVRCVAFSPVGGLVPMASDQTVQIIDLKSRRAIATLDGFDDYIDNRGVAFSHHGRYLAAKGGTVVRIWEVGKWESPLQQFEGAPKLKYNNGVAFSPDDTSFATRVPGGLRFWNTTTWLESRFEKGGDALGADLNYSRDGEWLAISDWNSIEIRDATTLDTIPNFTRETAAHETFVLSIDSSAEFMAAGYRNGEVILWETKTWREVGKFQAHPSFVFALAFSPDGQTLVTGGSDQVIKVWDVARLMADVVRAGPPIPIRKLRGHQEAVYALTFAPDGQTLASTSKDGTAKFWNSIAASQPAGLPNSEDPVWFAPDRARLITLNGDGRLHLWDTLSRRDLGHIGPPLDAEHINARTVSDDGEWLALGMSDGVIELWNLSTNQREKSWKDDDLAITHLAFSRRGGLLAASSERPANASEHGEVQIWDTVTGQRELDFMNAFGPLEFSPDDRLLAATRFDGTVVIWGLRTRQPVAEIPGNLSWVGSMAFSPVDDLLATGSEEPIVRIWDMASCEEVDCLKVSRMCIADVAFTGDGRTLIARNVDNAIELWNVATGKELFDVGYFMQAYSFLLSPNGEYLALSRDAGSSGQRRVELWRAPPFEEIAAAEARRQTPIDAQ